MADLIKKIKIKKQDGTYTDYIPIGAEAKNVDCSDGESVEYKINKKPYYFNNVADMKADTKLKVGDMAITLGYYEPNDGGAGEYEIINGNYIVDNGSYHQLDNNLFAKLIIKEQINIKQLGAYGDNFHDDTEKIQLALNNYSNIYIPSGIFYITNTLSLIGQNSGKTDIRIECKGTIVFNHGFKGSKLFFIKSIQHQNLHCEGLTLMHQSFLNTSRSSVHYTERTSFEGLVIEECCRVHVNNITIVGVNNRALVIHRLNTNVSAFETKITNADIWGGGVEKANAYNTSVPENLDPGINSYYTTGIVIGNDNILSNIVIAGYSIGLDMEHGGNEITNLHIWGSRLPLIYAVLARAGNNQLTNLYLDGLVSNNIRAGAGIYELKTSDITSSNPINLSSNHYTNVFWTVYQSEIPSDALDVPVAVEMGDPNVITTSENCSVKNLTTGYDNKHLYRLHGGAIGNPDLDHNGFRNKGSQYIPFNNLKYDATKTSITDILKSIIPNYFGTHYAYTNEICFITNNFNSYFTNGFQYTQKTLTYKIESCSEGALRCTIQGAYEWPVQAECGYLINRDLQTGIMNFYYYSTPHTIFANSLPSGEYGYLKGTCCICNNKPYWLDNSFQWRDANGNLPE